MADGLKFKIGADVEEAVTGSKKFASSLEILQNQLVRLQKLAALPNLSFKQQERLNSLLSKSGQELDKFARAAKNVTPGVNAASQSMINIGRVAQDLPFGFIGIANNLNPLLESFQRLRIETGSSGAALKALGSSLIGGGGLGLAVSALTAILTFSQLGFSAWSRGAKGAKEETDEFKKSIKDLGSIQIDAIGSVQGQIAQVRELAKAVGDSNKPYTERKRALEELKEINQSYFGDLSLEEKKLATLTSKVEDYTKALIIEAIQKKFSDAIADSAIAIGEQERAVEKARQALTNAQKELKAGAAAASLKPLGKEGLSGTTELLSLNNKVIAANKKLSDENEKLTQLDIQRINQNNALNKATEDGLKFKTLHVQKTKEEESALDKEIKKIKEEIAALEELKKMAGLLNKEEFHLADLKVKLAIDENIKEGTLNPQQLQREIDAIVNDADVHAKIPIVPVAPKQAIAGIGPVTGNGAGDAIAAAGEAAAAIAQTNEHLLKMQQLTNGIISVVPEIGRAFSSVFEDIASGGKNALQQFGQAIAGVVKKLIAAAITAAIFTAIISAATGGSFGAGTTATALSTFKSLFGQLSGIKLAGGGITTGPTSALIGDNPGGREAVIPLDDRILKNLRGEGNGGGYVAETRIGFDELIIGFRRAERRNGFLT